MTKATRKLTNIDFNKEGMHVALVSKQQNGPANGYDYALIMKSRSPEFIKKAQQVQVTLELPEFLRKFFHLYGEDVEILARMMGYVPPTTEENEWNYEDYIQEKVESFQILKSLNESKDFAGSLARLSDTDYLSLIEDQAMLEKAFENKIDKPTDSSGSTVEVEENKTVESKDSKVNKSNTKGKKMDELVEIQKSLDAKSVELQKALDTIKAMEDDKKAAVVKARTEVIKALAGDEKQTEILVKASLNLDDADFTAYTEVLKANKASVETSNLFVEKGVSSDVEQEVLSGPARVKAMIEKSNKK